MHIGKSKRDEDAHDTPSARPVRTVKIDIDKRPSRHETKEAVGTSSGDKNKKQKNTADRGGAQQGGVRGGGKGGVDAGVGWVGGGGGRPLEVF